MFRHNYQFKGVGGDMGVGYFFQQRITEKEAKQHAQYLKEKYNFLFVHYYRQGKVKVVEDE